MFEDRTYCGNINLDHIDKGVQLNGWIDAIRDHGHIIFIHLRDISGIVQLVFDSKDSKELYDNAVQLKEEYIIKVKGKVRIRTKGTENPNIKTGEVEVVADEFIIHSYSQTLPFKISEKAMVYGEEISTRPDDVDEDLRLKHRYLDLRRPSVQERFIKRHKINKIIRDFLDNKNFLELETPVLTRSTPEGARDYLVPSRIQQGKFYALPQSPQLFKQLFMMSGMERYFQIVKCYRDEDLRPNRQPEFTQLDLEASFIDEEFIYELIEALIQRIFAEGNINLYVPFKRITYSESMNLYGTDAPDLRFDMSFKDATKNLQNTNYTIFKRVIESKGYIKGFCVTENADQLTKNILQNEYALKIVQYFGGKGMTWMRMVNGELESNIAQFFTKNELEDLKNLFEAKDGNVIVLVAESSLDLVNKILGRLRLHIANRLDIIPKDKFVPVWIIEFPMFEFAGKNVAPLHHPFTSPDQTDIDTSNIQELLSLKSRAYDVVINGEELGGGSIRINDAALQKDIFNALGFTQQEIKQKFGFFIKALEYGAPPHGGIALGLDRVNSMVLQTSSIRDVIPFPKNRNAACPLTEAPTVVENLQLQELNLINNADLLTVAESGATNKIEEISEQKQTGLTDDDIKKLAKLARLKLKEEDLEGIKNDLNTIIDYFGQLNELDTDDVKPMHHVLNEKNGWRDDKPSPSGISQEIIDNGPLTENNYFKVPKILDT
jgi:aspartyl-tRNA synthetase